MKVYTARLSEQGANRVYLKIDVEARDAQIHELLHCALNELPAGDCHQTIYWINKALLLV